MLYATLHGKIIQKVNVMSLSKNIYYFYISEYLSGEAINDPENDTVKPVWENVELSVCMCVTENSLIFRLQIKNYSCPQSATLYPLD